MPDETRGLTVEAAMAAVCEIIATMDERHRPTKDGYATLIVRDYEPTHGPAPVLATVRYRWPEIIAESEHRAATIDAATHTGIAPVWVFELTPIGADDWYFAHFFAAPSRTSQGMLFRARRRAGGWKLDRAQADWPSLSPDDFSRSAS